MNERLKLMLKKAKQTLKQAYAPYSNFKVSCCLCADDNTLYTGVNVENTSYGLSVCAETSAICQMIAAGKRRVNSLLIITANNQLSSPCGACRQIIYEFSKPDTTVYLASQDTILKTITIHDLLPMGFSLTLQNGQNDA